MGSDEKGMGRKEGKKEREMEGEEGEEKKD